GGPGEQALAGTGLRHPPLGHRRLDVAGGDAVDVDVVRGGEPREVLRVGEDPAEGGVVAGDVRDRAVRREGAHVHDLPVAPFHHPGENGLAAEEDPGQVPVDLAAPLVVVGVQVAADRGGCRACDVAEDVDG